MERSVTSTGIEEREATTAPVVDLLEGYLSEEEYARQRGVSIRTCQRDRALRQGPPYTIIGRQVYYRVEAVRAWMLARERDGERQPQAPRRRNTFTLQYSNSNYIYFCDEKQPNKQLFIAYSCDLLYGTTGINGVSSPGHTKAYNDTQRS